MIPDQQSATTREKAITGASALAAEQFIAQVLTSFEHARFDRLGARQEARDLSQALISQCLRSVPLEARLPPVAALLKRAALAGQAAATPALEIFVVLCVQHGLPFGPTEKARVQACILRLTERTDALALAALREAQRALALPTTPAAAQELQELAALASLLAEGSDQTRAGAVLRLLSLQGPSVSAQLGGLVHRVVFSRASQVLTFAPELQSQVRALVQEFFAASPERQALLCRQHAAVLRRLEQAAGGLKAVPPLAYLREQTARLGGLALAAVANPDTCTLTDALGLVREQAHLFGAPS
jgi:hypothetical protein